MEININKAVLRKYSAEQLGQWAKDNGLTKTQLEEVEKELHPVKAAEKEEEEAKKEEKPEKTEKAAKR